MQSDKFDSQDIMYFSRAKSQRFKRILFGCIVVVVLFYICFPTRFTEKSCSILLPRLGRKPKDASQVWSIRSGVQRICSSTDEDTGETQSEWDLFYHLGGNGPWIPKVEGVLHNGLDPPEGCKVDQVHMVLLSSLSGLLQGTRS